MITSRRSSSDLVADRRICSMCSLIDRVLLDVEVARRDVGLGLVVVVVRDEVLDRVLREELAELGVELRRERLVRRHDQRRPAEARDDVGHRVGLARAGDAEQRLEREPVVACLRSSLSIASGWSPAGANVWCRRNGLSGNVTEVARVRMRLRCGNNPMAQSFQCQR